jgi:exopolysaccharide production protein ExoQ
MTQIATLVFALGILTLFALDRDGKIHTSKALWLPVVWLLIVGSRPVSAWLQMAPPRATSQYLEGSPIDRDIFTGLLVLGIIVLFQRRGSFIRLLKANGAIFFYLLYCAVSIFWSDYPEVAFKRWIKFLGDFVMILIVATDQDWLGAVKRVFAGVGFVLLPASILFIKFYPALGRAYSPWEGAVSNLGVTGDKNMLGLVCLIFGLASSWRLFQELSGSRGAKTLFVHAAVVFMALWLLVTCNSMTSLSCFVLGGGVMAATTFLKLARKRTVVHVLVVGVVLVCVSPLFLGLGGGLLTSLGRNSTLTGRTGLWVDVLALDVDPILGTGFESFWLGKRLATIWSMYWWHPVEAHNGYLEIFLNLGWVGVILLATVIISGYRNVVNRLTWDPEAGSLQLAYFVVGLIYNLTEAAIHTGSLVWMAFVLAIAAVPKKELTQIPSGGRPNRDVYRLVGSL